MKRSTITNLDNLHHDKKKEMPIIIYVASKLYSKVRSQALIDCLLQLGLCIPYDKALSIIKYLYEAWRNTSGH